MTELYITCRAGIPITVHITVQACGRTLKYVSFAKKKKTKQYQSLLTKQELATTDETQKATYTQIATVL